MTADLRREEIARIAPLTENEERALRLAFVPGRGHSLAQQRNIIHRLLATLDAARSQDTATARIAALPMYDENDRIEAMNGTVRKPRTPADYVEAYRTRVLGWGAGGMTPRQPISEARQVAAEYARLSAKENQR